MDNPTSPHIKVYAPLSLPPPVPPLTDSGFAASRPKNNSDWHWVHCLTLPLSELRTLKLSRKPYKWIRYSMGAILGARGDLSTSSEDSGVGVDYEVEELSEQSEELYYHIDDSERTRLCSLDWGMEGTRETSSAGSERRVRFREAVAARDGRRCLLTEGPLTREVCCDAVHLVPHCKGDNYIAEFTQRRSRDPTGSDVIEDVDSPRNGLFLNKSIHPIFGTDIAILQTPNFAMSTADISFTSTSNPSEKRWTYHLFVSDPDSDNSSRSPLRISDTEEYPPSILFDAVYAGCVYHHFGARELKEAVSAAWRDEEFVAHEDYRDVDASAARRKWAEDRELEARRKPDWMDKLMMVPYMLLPKEELHGMLDKAQERAEEEASREAREKVGSWIRDINERDESHT